MFPAMSFAPGQDHDRRGPERDHVLPEAHEHLRRGLPADAAPHVRLPREHGAEILGPSRGDGVAVKHHALLARLRIAECDVGVSVVCEGGPVAGERLGKEWRQGGRGGEEARDGKASNTIPGLGGDRIDSFFDTSQPAVVFDERLEFR